MFRNDKIAQQQRKLGNVSKILEEDKKSLAVANCIGMELRPQNIFSELLNISDLTLIMAFKYLIA